MFRNYLKIALRNFRHHKLFTAVNVFGLALGMASFIVIMQYVRFELSYDRHLPDSKRMYRVIAERSNEGVQVDRRASTFGALGQEAKKSFPEVDNYTRIWTGQGPVVMTINNQPFTEQMAVADGNFPTFFGLEMISGTQSNVLKEPNTAILSETAAEKYYKGQDPVGKVFKISNQYDSEMSSPLFTITGVYKDIPQNAHLRTDVIGSFNSINNTAKWGPNYMDNYPVYTYLLLNPNAPADRLEQKLNLSYQNTDRKEFYFRLQPVEDIHLYSDVQGEISPSSREKSIYFLVLIASFILIIAWINYINLSNAASIRRSLEVGVRKSVGGNQGQLIIQFLLETVLINLFATVLAAILSQLALPLFNQFIEKSISFAWWNNLGFGLGLLLVLTLGSLLAGLYPAFVLSGLKPANLLRNQLLGSWTARVQRAVLRKGLVVFQFTISMTLIALTFAIYQQLNFMRNRDLGVNIEQVLVLPSPTVGIGDPTTFAGKVESFKNELLNYPSVKGFSSSLNIPGQAVRTNIGVFRRAERSETEKNSMGFFFADEGFVPLYGLKMLAGQNFTTSSYEGDVQNRGAILNEAALKTLGFPNAKSAIGKNIFAVPGRLTPVIGVVQNYNQQSLRKTVEPIAIQYSPAASFGMSFSIKINGDNPQQTLALVEKQWNSMFPGNPFDYFFLNEYFDRQYRADVVLGKVFGLFAGLAILVACMGLFGLALLNSGQRTKEIGIRRVFGATGSDILFVLSKEFITLVLVAVAVAIPITYFAISYWLDNFAFRIPISPWLFIFPSLVVLFIATATVVYQAITQVRAKAINSLRYQ